MDPELNQKFSQQAEMLANRVKKRFKHLGKRFARQNIDVFRLYDGEIPEIRAAVDWYAGHLVIAEYMRRQSVSQWLPLMGEAVAGALGVPAENVHLKERRAGKQDGKRYERIDYTQHKLVVKERDLKFYVNLADYVDTGLFSDHRDTRRMGRKAARGKDFLNLYCYTGAFTCYAAKGGARTTVSVDRSETAISWLRENLALNGIPETGNTLIQSPVFAYLDEARQKNQTFDLAVVDPPSFSTSKTEEKDFDIAADHTTLLRAVIRIMRKGAVVFFSTNHQNFELKAAALDITGLEEITDRTIPEDYRNKRKRIHRCWKITTQTH